MTNAKAITDVRKSFEAKRGPLRKTIAQLDNLPAAKEAAIKAREEQAAYLNGPSRYNNTDDRDRRIALDTEVTRTASIVQAIEREAIPAQRELERIEAMLNAPADVERLKKERVAVVADCAATYKRVRALRDVVEAIHGQRDQVEAKATADQTEAADRAIEARLEGKPVPPTKADGATTADLAKLDAELAAAQRQLNVAFEKLAAFSEEAKAVRTKLLRALALASELDFLQALEDIRPAVEQHAAITALAGLGHLYGDALAIPLNEVAVQEIVNELAVEYRGWEPAEGIVVSVPAKADANETAESGAKAAAA